MITVTDETFSAYLCTIDMYESITKTLPLPDWLSSEQIKRLTLPEEMALEDSDFTAFCVRLMLQRKYFVWGQDLCLRDLLNAAREDGRFDVARIDELTATLDGIRDASFDVAGSEGEIRL